jgi:hypothetical protein
MAIFLGYERLTCRQLAVCYQAHRMVDILALALSHGLLLLAAWRLVRRADLDVETPGGAPPPAAREPARRGRPRMRTGRESQTESGGGDA